MSQNSQVTTTVTLTKELNECSCYTVVFIYVFIHLFFVTMRLIDS